MKVMDLNIGIQRMKQRNKSINFEAPNKMKYINSLFETPSKHLINSSKNSSSNVIVNVSKDHSSNQSNYSCNSIKINKNFKDTKKGHSKAISINISSIQSPEHKVTYEIEDIEDNELKLESVRKTPKQKSLKEVIDDLEVNTETSLKIKFMKDKFKDKYDKLIDLLVHADNPWEIVNDIGAIKSIVGDDFAFAQRFLKFIIAVSKSPK
jgi:hypothetical protein